MKKLNIDLNSNQFLNFQSSRYSVSAKINVENAWKLSKEKNCSFFILSLGCLMDALNSVPHLKRRIIGNEAVEFDYLNGVTPIMVNEEEGIYKELLVKPQNDFKSFMDWYGYVESEIRKLADGKTQGFDVELDLRDVEPIANFSCIPWLDFESITTCVHTGNQIQPLITWGKVNENYEMTVSITVSHIFVNGRELALFYERAQENFSTLRL